MPKTVAFSGGEMARGRTEDFLIPLNVPQPTPQNNSWTRQFLVFRSLHFHEGFQLTTSWKSGRKNQRQAGINICIERDGRPYITMNFFVPITMIEYSETQIKLQLKHYFISKLGESANPSKRK